MQKNKQPISINVSEDTAIAALSQISSLGLDPTPDLYQIWYCYYNGEDQDLIKKVDKLMQDNAGNIREILFLPLIAFFKKEIRALEEFKDDSEQVISNTYTNLHDVSENTRRLGSFIHETSTDKSKKDKDIIKEIQEESRNAMAENERLHQVIEAERHKMLQLQENLQKVKNELILDSLTNIHNRRHFDISLKQAIKEASIANKPLSLFIFDIDHFKKFNDTHGHLVGDMVLKFVGYIMKTIFPNKTHHLFRYGGEEFAIIFDGVSKADTMKYAYMLSNAISKKEMTKKSTNEKIGNITISGGIADKKKRDTVETLIARADLALYASKNKGRNQVNFAA
ncbi:MAG: diguanylate cyclase [Alphaproteobacteria bacterium]|jgi:diguanylate cyclase